MFWILRRRRRRGGPRARHPVFRRVVLTLMFGGFVWLPVTGCIAGLLQAAPIPASATVCAHYARWYEATRGGASPDSALLDAVRDVPASHTMRHALTRLARAERRERYAALAHAEARLYSLCYSTSTHHGRHDNEG